MDKQDRQIRIRLLVGPQDVASSKMHMLCLLSQIGVRPHRNLKETKLVPPCPQNGRRGNPVNGGRVHPLGWPLRTIYTTIIARFRRVLFGFVEKGNPHESIGHD